MPTRLPDRAARTRPDREAEPPQIADVAIALGSLLLVLCTLLALQVDGGTGPSRSHLHHGEYSPFEISKTAPW